MERYSAITRWGEEAGRVDLESCWLANNPWEKISQSMIIFGLLCEIYYPVIWITPFSWLGSDHCNFSRSNVWWSSSMPSCSQNTQPPAWRSCSCCRGTDSKGNFHVGGPYPTLLCGLLLFSTVKIDIPGVWLLLSPISIVLSCLNPISLFFLPPGCKSLYWSVHPGQN